MTAIEYSAREKLAARKHLQLAARLESVLNACSVPRWFPAMAVGTLTLAVARDDVREARHHALRVLGPEGYRRAGGPEL